MDFGKKNYGRLGYLRTSEWKQMLRSNKGLFQVRGRHTPTKTRPPYVRYWRDYRRTRVYGEYFL
jgi:hypothetical protein